MPSMLDSSTRTTMLERLARLAPDAHPRWGRMSASQMVAHLDVQMRDILGELSVKPRRKQFRNPIVQWFIIEVLPWPRGKLPTAPEYVVASPGDFTGLVSGLRARLEVWAARGERDAGAVHPLFGPLSGRQLGKLLHKHWSHHLEQFGV